MVPHGDSNPDVITGMHPQCIIFVYEGHREAQYPYKHYRYKDEAYTLVIYHLFTPSFDGETNAVLMEKVFKNAWHWYAAYMAWEDTQISDND